MKKVLLMLLAVVFLAGAVAPAAYASQPAHAKGSDKAKMNQALKFKDVKGHWAENVLLEMNAKGFVKGYQDCTYKPANVVSKLEAVVMIVRALGLEEEAQEAKLSAPVKNEKQIPSWAAGYVQVAYDQGILTEGDLKAFRPNQGAKRIEVALWIARALDLDQKIQQKIQLDFVDDEDIPGNLNGIVIIMVQTGIMQGAPGHYFWPNKPITRAEMAVLLDRIDGKVADNQGKEISGKIKSVDDDTITVEKTGWTKEFDFSEDVTVYLDGDLAEVEDLEEGYRVKVVLDNDGKVSFVKAEDAENEEDFEGEITQIVLGDGAQITVKSGNKEKAFRVNGSTEIEKDGKEIFLSELEIGWEVSVESENGVAIDITVDNEEDNEDDEETEEEYEGTITEVDSIGHQSITIEDEDGRTHTFDVDEDTEIILDDEDQDLEDLESGFAVTVTVIDDVATRIEAESEEEEFSGEIVALTLGDEQTVVIETDENDRFTFDVTEDTEIELDGDRAELDDLKVGDTVEITAQNGAALTIDAEREDD
ncbi:S-layer homology domain-containing protein [Candidatus Formimonas warabiya]|uniref:SLH domain-containing protein n=1 Tax=Formimonas warabiya TaxID=1761012 RepID=A0A3G1KP58_FORW1|nr:S-layer homology domain-containing protein [Candidatus Formimonas warabiya]ATW23905.1 hypothetical protein DCMF_03030 [Candidatus Formimonas warabiya]